MMCWIKDFRDGSLPGVQEIDDDGEGLLRWSSARDSMLPLQGAQVQSLSGNRSCTS